MRKLLFILTMLSVGLAKGQNSGYNGRHLLLTYPVSTTILNQGIGLGLDYTFNRKFSFEALFQMGTKRVFTTTTNYYGFSEIFEHGINVGPISNPRSKAKFKSLTLGLTYFLNSSLPAPLGNYIQVNAGSNVVNFESFYHIVLFYEPYGDDSRNVASVPIKVNFNNVPFSSLSLSAGRRRVFYNNLSIDLRLSANYFQYLYRSPEQLTPIKNYGGNLAGFGLVRNAEEPAATDFFTGQSFGLSFHVLIGILTL